MNQQDAVEIVIRARNDAKRALDEAARQIAALQNNTTKTGVVARAQFGEVARVVGTISPAAGAAAGQVASLAAATAGLGPAGLAIAGVTVAVLGMAAAFGVAFGEVKKLAAQAEDLRNLSEATGIATGPLQAMVQGFEDAGGSAQALRVSIRFLNRAIADNSVTLGQLGIKTKDTRQALLELSEVFASMPEGPQRTRLAMELLGARTADQVLPILARGRSALLGFEAATQAAGKALSTGMLATLASVDDEMDQLQRTIEGAKQQLVLAFVPAVRASIPALQGLADAAQDTIIMLTFLGAAWEKWRERGLFGVADMARITAQITPFIEAVRKAREELRAAPERNKTIFELMRDQGRLTEEQLRRLLKLSDDALRQLGTSRAVVRVAIEGFDVEAMKKAQEAATKAAAEHVKKVNEVMLLLGKTRSEAEKIVQVLERGEAAKRAEALREAYTKALLPLRDVSKEIAALPDPKAKLDFARSIQDIAELTGETEEFVREMLQAKQNSEDTAKAFAAIGKAVPGKEMIEFNKHLADVLSVSTITVDLMRSAFSELAASLHGVFRDIVEGVATAKSIVVSLVASMVNAILAEIAKLAAARAIGSKIGQSVIGAIGSFIGGVFGGAAAPRGAAPAPAAAPGRAAPARQAQAAAPPRIAPSTLPPRVERVRREVREVVTVQRIERPREERGPSILETAFGDLRERLSAFETPLPPTPPQPVLPREFFETIRELARGVNDLAKMISDGTPIAGDGMQTVNIYAQDSNTFDEFLKTPMGKGRLAELRRTRNTTY